MAYTTPVGVSSLSDILQQRIQQNNQVQTNNPTANAGLTSTYYTGGTSFATQGATDRLKQQSQNGQNLSDSVNGIMQGKIADANAARAKAQADAALAAQKAATAAASKQRFNISYSTGLTAAQKRALGSLGGGSAGGSLYAGSSNTGTYQTAGNRANTSGAAGAVGGTSGSGTYKYVYNNKLDSQRNGALALATSYLGTPYVLGGESHTSMDCSGLVQLVYSKMGFTVPTHSAADQGARATGQRGGAADRNAIPGVKTALGNLQPGDLIAWNDGSHIAIYAGRNAAGQIMIIESANPTRGTIARPLWASPSAVSGLHVTFPGETNGTAVRSKQSQIGN